MACVAATKQLVCVKSAAFDQQGHRLFDVRNAARGAVTCVAAAHVDGLDFVVTGSDEGAVQVWSARDGGLLRSLAGHIGPVHCAVALPGGVVVTGGEDQQARTWSLDDGALLRSFSGHCGRVVCAASLEHSLADFVATGSNDGGVCFWRFARGAVAEAPCTGHSAEVTCMAELAGAKVVATGALDGSLRIWRPASGKLVHDLKASRRSSDAVRCLAAVGEDWLVVGLASGAVRAFSAVSGQVVQEFSGHKINVTCAAAVPGTGLVVTASVVGDPKVWEAGTGRCVSELQGQKSWVRNIANIPASKFVIALASDGTAMIFDAACGEVIRRLDNRKQEIADDATDCASDKFLDSVAQALRWVVLQRCPFRRERESEAETEFLESKPFLGTPVGKPLPTLINRPWPRMFGKSRKAQE